MRLVLVAIAVPLIAACNPLHLFTVHKMEIQQGNYVTQEMVSQLRPGMTKDQVRFVLGTPLMADIFHENRWDYVFRRQPQNSNRLEERRLSVFFEDGKLTRVAGDVVPSADTAAKTSDSETAK
jgi:outer membrane protein assembly factor BamE